MKHSFIKSLFYFVALLPFSFTLASCSDLETGGTVTFEISPSLYSNARDVIIPNSDSPFVYIPVILRGDYSASQVISFVRDSDISCRATFDSVPVGSNVYLEANCFLPDGSWSYTGTSSSFTVEAGENTVTVKMKEINNDVENIPISVTSAYYPDPSQPTNFVGIGGLDTTGNLIIDNDGFFELMTNDVSISKGKWRGSANQGGTLYLTEYIYSSIVPPDPSDPSIQVVFLDNTIIVTSLSEIPVQINSDGVFSFTLKNGAIISGNVGV